MQGEGWKEALADLGMPLGAARPTPSLFDADKARHAVHASRFDDLSATEREALAAWLAAFQHHWPARFAEVLAGVGVDALARARVDLDDNRYLKLRRIAIDNLAKVL